MGFDSQQGYVGFRTQAAQGTHADPGAVAPNNGIFVRLRSGALGGNRDLLTPDPEIGGNRDVPDVQFGPIGFSGEYDIYPRLDSLAFFLKNCLGTVVTTGAAATGYTQTITPSDGDVPWVSVEEGIAGGYENFRYTDGKINTFHMEADATGYLQGTVGLIAITQAANGTPTAPANQVWDNSELIVGTNITVDWGGVQLPAKSFSLDINNNMEDDDYRLGSFFLGGLVAKRREVTMGVTIRPEDAALWRTAMWGSPAATAPGGRTFKDDVSISIASYQAIPGTAPTVNYSAQFAVPQVVIAPFALDPSGDDVIEHDLELRAVRPDPAVDILTATVVNSLAAIP